MHVPSACESGMSHLTPPLWSLWAPSPGACHSARFLLKQPGDTFLIITKRPTLTYLPHLSILQIDMGNSDSQPALPSTAGTGFSLPRRPKPCSLRFRPTKRKVLSPQSWWGGRAVGQGGRLRAPFVHSQYSCFGELSSDRGDPHRASSGTASPWDLGGGATGVLYAERDTGLDRPVGPVHLLQLAEASDHVEANGPPLRTSKGSSLSSEGSWYDSPWGATGELSDADRSCSSGNIEDTRDSASSSGPLEDGSAGGRTMIGGSPSAPSGGPLALQPDLRGFHSLTPANLGDLYGNPRVTPCSSVSGGGAEESRPQPGGFGSHTLPCRKAGPNTDSGGRKGLLKGRMRSLGDWTGSLSRKRRRLQVPAAAHRPAHTQGRTCKCL